MRAAMLLAAGLTALGLANGGAVAVLTVLILGSAALVIVRVALVESGARYQHITHHRRERRQPDRRVG
jgi:hypothetical protein